MQELKPGAYAGVLPLIEQCEIESHMPLVYSLLEGRQAGKLFVDDAARPRACVVCPVNGFYFAFGDAGSPTFPPFIPELLVRHLVPKCALFATSADWRETLDGLFSRKIVRAGLAFQPWANARSADWKPRVPPGFTLEPMKESVLEHWTRGIDPWVIRIWGGAAEFAAKSFGFCLISEGKIASIAAACGIGRGEAEVEVGTVHELRRRGLATMACTAFIERCGTLGLTPTWTCESGNTPSLELGNKLGFVEYEEIHGYPLESTFRVTNGGWGLNPNALQERAAGAAQPGGG